MSPSIPDYAAICQRTDDDHIVGLCLRDLMTDAMEYYTREEVIDLIDDEKKVIRVEYIEENEGDEGLGRADLADVDVVTFQGKTQKWLRTDPNQIEADNLEHLVECTEVLCSEAPSKS